MNAFTRLIKKRPRTGKARGQQLSLGRAFFFFFEAGIDFESLDQSCRHVVNARRVSIIKSGDGAVCIDERDEECRVTRKHK